MKRTNTKQINQHMYTLSITRTTHSEPKAVCALNNKISQTFRTLLGRSGVFKKLGDFRFLICLCGICKSLHEARYIVMQHSRAGAANSSARIKHMWEHHFPHGPYPLALHLAKRRGMPRKRRERYDMDSPDCGTLYEVKI